MMTTRLALPVAAILFSSASMVACGGSGSGNHPLGGNGGGGASGAGEGGVGGSGVNAGPVLITSDGGNGDADTFPDANPCSGAIASDTCKMVASGPACGDGLLNQASEACDDGNALPGDGCNGLCQVEPNFDCPTPGQPCVFKYKCGNGVLEPGEVCDDGNTQDGDGCSATCDAQSGDFVCPTPGQLCTRTSFCGDGRVKGAEKCDDGNTKDGDGCDAACQVETGWLCLVPGKACSRVLVCGDGKLSPSKGELCDDGNTKDGDGCSADCRFIASGWACPTPGAQCVSLIKCGDGIVNGSEQCDDANTDPNDGCDNCVLTPGYECPFPGSKCVVKCGDGILTGSEQCDDGNVGNGDGCSSTCRWEAGMACTGTPGMNYTCHKTVCGDGIKEGAEGCDDGSLVPNDGCDAKCHVEPACVAGAGCSSVCGDGVVVNEQCDDGNSVSGDGCSSSCTVEPGYSCSNAQPCEKLNGSCILRVPIVFRDFVDSAQGGHPDFQVGCGSLQTGIAKPLLNAKGLPDLLSNANACIQSATSFAQWYDFSLTGAWGSAPIVGDLVLWDNGSGGYVNRYGADGTRWGGAAVSNTTARWCSNTSNDCAACGTLAAGETCLGLCLPWGASSTATCAVTTTTTLGPTFDGNPLFFPVDESVLGARGAVTPVSQYVVAAIPQEVYGGGWVTDPSGVKHNFAFTSHVRYWFTYDSTQTYQLDFTGDDDVWVYVNGMLAVDLGGLHVPTNGSVTIDAAKATALKLGTGKVYEIDVFQAERKQNGSSYRLTLSGFNSSTSVCTPACGDGVATPGEQCDDGSANTGGYGKCQADCTRGGYCGDKVINGPEQCDNGVNTSAYGTTGCAPGCVFPARCGDAAVQTEFGEQCDDGKNDGTYNGCTADCQRAGWCGDAHVDAPQEECDDGKNDGTYNNCAPDCKLGPRCGDGILQAEFGEVCDDGNTVAGDGCSPNCKAEGICGDAFVDKAAGEQCDDGTNLGGYGLCAPGCKLGPHCGDGVVQTNHEQCDDSINAGGYGACAPGCVLGPHCGDGVVQSAYEECDDGNMTSGDGCSVACKTEISIPR